MSFMKYGYVSRKINGKFSWWSVGFGGRLPPPVMLKAKTLQGAKIEAMKYFRKYLGEIAKSLP